MYICCIGLHRSKEHKDADLDVLSHVFPDKAGCHSLECRPDVPALRVHDHNVHVARWQIQACMFFSPDLGREPRAQQKIHLWDSCTWHVHCWNQAILA